MVSSNRAANDRVSRVEECGEELNSHLANTSSVVFSFSRGWGFSDIGTHTANGAFMFCYSYDFAS